MSQPTAHEQYMLELINAERAKAGAQPLAFDGDLNESSELHSRWMIDTDTFSHTGSGGSTSTQRMTAAGYVLSGSWATGENIAWASTRSPAGYQDEVALLHTNLMNSSGHRANILNANFKEVGVGFEVGPYQNWDAAFVTQNFARSGTQSFVTGVAFDDQDGDRAYDPGEGLGGITVTAVSSTGARYTTTTMDAGGYDIALPNGTYTVTFSGPSIATTTQQATVSGLNVKVDLVDPATTGGTPTPPPPPPAPNSIVGNSSNNSLSGTAGADTIQGLGGRDTLYGNGGDDRLDGGTGNDTLYGGIGNDVLLGGSGGDTLRGEAGNDVLTGGSEADVFVFRTGWGADTVTDFQNGIDHIDLRGNGLSYAGLSLTQADIDRDGSIDDIMLSANGQSIALLDTSRSVLDTSDFWF